MAESTVVYTPENQANNALPWMLAGQNNNGFFGGAGGSAFLGGLFGSILPSLGGWFNGGYYRGGNAAGDAALGAQATANANTAQIMQAINGTDADVRQLTNASGANYNAVRSDINAVQGALATMSIQLGMTPLQIMNAIQSGNATLANQLSQCCCENRLLTTQQGYEAQIRTLEQTNQLGSQSDRNTNAIIGAINAQTVAMNDQFCAAKERDLQAEINRQSDIITQLRGQISNDKQTEMFTAAFNALNNKITELSAKQPNTVPVQWPALTAVNTTPYVNGGYYGNAFGFGNGVAF